MWVKLNNKALDLSRNVGVPSGWAVWGPWRFWSGLGLVKSHSCTLGPAFLWGWPKSPILVSFCSVPVPSQLWRLQSEVKKNKAQRAEKACSVPHTDTLPPTEHVTPRVKGNPSQRQGKEPDGTLLHLGPTTISHLFWGFYNRWVNQPWVINIWGKSSRKP